MARVNRLEKGIWLINKDENKFCHNANNKAQTGKVRALCINK